MSESSIIHCLNDVKHVSAQAGGGGGGQNTVTALSFRPVTEEWNAEEWVGGSESNS